MAIDPSSMQAHSGFANFVDTHKPLVIGGGVVAVLLVASHFMTRNKAPAAPGTGAPDLTGLTNGNLVYVPTQTSFTTENIKYGPQSNDPNLTTITGSPVTIGSNNPKTTTTTTTTSTTNNPPGPKPPVVVPPPVSRNPPPKPPVPVTTKRVIWDQRYTIRGGDTLSAIAASYTRTLRGAGMPGSQLVTWNDLYAHNTATINQWSNSHGNPIPGGPWNNIFPGEVITTPRWG